MSWTATIVADIDVAKVATTGGHRELTLDLFVPGAEVKPALPSGYPLLIYIHGGGWQGGSNDRPPAYRSILGRGFALASLQYRFSSEGSGTQMLADLRRGVQVARDAAAARGVNTRAWFLWGISAGGHLVSLLGHRINDPIVVGTAPASDDPTPVPGPTAIAPWCGVFDLTHYASLDEIGEQWLETVPEIERDLTGADEEERARLSPIKHISSESPPHFFVHGMEDTLVPPGQSEMMHAALGDAGVASELFLVPGREHGMPPDDSTEIHRTLDFLLAQAPSGGDG